MKSLNYPPNWNILGGSGAYLYVGREKSLERITMPEPAPTPKPVSDPSKELTIERLGDSRDVYESIAALPFKFKLGERTSFDHTSQTAIRAAWNYQARDS